MNIQNNNHLTIRQSIKGVVVGISLCLSSLTTMGCNKGSGKLAMDPRYSEAQPSTSTSENQPSTSTNDTAGVRIPSSLSITYVKSNFKECNICNRLASRTYFNKKVSCRSCRSCKLLFKRWSSKYSGLNSKNLPEHDKNCNKHLGNNCIRCRYERYVARYRQ